MGLGANVTTQQIDQAIGACKVSVLNLQQNIAKLSKGVQSVGSDWSDGQFQKLLSITGACEQAMRKPIGELETTIDQLTKIRGIIENYESTM